jgi:transcriptional regulator with XRE-family HTH domain
MTGLGQKIRESRKLKGLSQEELADLAKVNLRTVQRVEANQNEPRGKTLNQLCKVLEINTEDILDFGKNTDSSYLVYFHLSVLTFLAIPLGNIILPLILWLTKKEKIIGLKEVGVNVLNFQILWTVFIFFSIIGMAFLKVLHYNTSDMFFYIIGTLYLLNIILPIFFAYKSKNGQSKKMYPSLIRWMK